MAEFEIKYANMVDEDAKILALKSTMPETLFGEAGVFRGRSLMSTSGEMVTSRTTLRNRDKITVRRRRHPHSERGLRGIGRGDGV